MKLDVSQAITARTHATVPFEGHAPAVSAVPFVSLSALAQALRRRWRLWAATGVAGMTAAIALSVAFRPPFSATTTLLLRHPAESSPASAMKTDVELLHTRTVAQGVINRLGLNLEAEEFLSYYQGEALSDLVLQITMNGPTANEAVARADALATEFLQFRRSEFERQSQVVVHILEGRKDALTTELATLTERINGYTPGSDAGTLAELLTRRTNAGVELAELRLRIDEISIDTVSAIENSRAVDPASEADRPLLKTLAANLAAGIVGGLATGAGWVMVAEVASDRVRRRRDVMLHLRAPVGVSIGRLRGPLWTHRQRFRQHLEKPRRDVTQVVRHFRSFLATSGTMRPALAVVSVDSDGPAGLFVASTAVELTNEGKNVLVVDLSPHSALAAVFAVPAGKTSTLRFERTDSKLWVYFPPDGLQHTLGDQIPELDVEPHDEPDVVLALAALDPALGAWHLSAWATTTVTVVTAGRPTTTALRSVSQMIQGAGLELASTVLVGADPRDESFGIPDDVPLARRSWQDTAILGNQ